MTITGFHYYNTSIHFIYKDLFMTQILALMADGYALVEMIAL
jgi:hypothetical protein